MKGALVTIVIIAAIGAGGVYWATAFNTDDVVVGETTYTVAERRTIASTILATGVIRLKVGAEVRVGAQMSGIVNELNVTVGSKIDKGDVIARIDSRSLEARLEQARAQVRVLEQEVERARVELARAEGLDVKKLVARTEVEDRTLDLAGALARLEKSRRDADVVKTDLGYAVISAPITGTIASVTTQKGETVAASFTTPTFVTIIAEDALEVIAMVDETDVGTVEAGNAAMFTVESFPALEFTGTVKQIAPKGAIISGIVNFEVMIDIESDIGELKPDMTANVSIRTAEREAIVLPTGAVQRDGFARFVLIDDGGELVRRPVTIGTRDTGFTEIRQGVAPGDRIAIVPQTGNGQDARG
jgi:RND family efflux transporter MFP subunit